MSRSLWLDQIEKKNYPQVEDTLTTDVLVIGGGITGISCAHELMKAGKDVILIDSNELLHGTTGHTTSKLTIQHGLIYHELFKKLGLEGVTLYKESNELAIQTVRQNVTHYGIDCDLVEATAAVYTCKDHLIRRIEREAIATRAINIDAKLTNALSLPYAIKRAITFPSQVAFHVVKYLLGILEELEKRNVRIYEKTSMKEVHESSEACRVTLENGHEIYAKDIIFATHYPHHKPFDLYFTKLIPTFSYVMAFKTKRSMDNEMVINVEKPVRSIRKALYKGEEILLVAGESHQATKTENKASHFDALYEFADYYFGVEEELYRFSTMDYETPDKLPFIGRANRSMEHIYVATGYGKWGMTKGIMASKILTDLIVSGESPYEQLYSPSRFKQVANTTFLAYNLSHPINWLKSKSMKRRPLESLDIDQQMNVRFGKKTLGVYKDEAGRMHIVETLCPHLKCSLHFNNAERTYDCPCHGSRFNYDGKLLDGPSKRDLKTYSLDALKKRAES